MDNNSIPEKYPPDDDASLEFPKEGPKWYYNPWVIVIAILALGPLGLPLLWSRPATNQYIKITVTIVVIALTVWMMQGVFTFYGELMNTVKELNATM